jgi:hypothetical protein
VQRSTGNTTKEVVQNVASETGKTKTVQYFDMETEERRCSMKQETGKIGRATL